MKFDLCGLSYYESGNVFTGNQGDFCYKIRPDEGNLKICLWRGPYCFDKSELLKEKEFPMDQAGFEQLHCWLEEEYAGWS